MAAEELGIDYDEVRPIIGDTGSLGYTYLTGGSRVDLLAGMAVIEAATQVIRQSLRARRQDLGGPRRRSSGRTARQAGVQQRRRVQADVAQGHRQDRGQDRRADRRPCASTPRAPARASARTWSTSRSTPRPGKVTILRYTVAQDAGKAVHPSYVEGQIQGGVVQGIGWALNEEYIYGADGRLQNPGFLDYRMPVASDLPMIDTVIVEVPNPNHPYGVRGVGETPIVPPLAAIANAMAQATGHPLHRAADVAAFMAQALVDEVIDHPDTALVSRDFLRAELRTLGTELRECEPILIGTIWRVVLTVFGLRGFWRARWSRC